MKKYQFKFRAWKNTDKSWVYLYIRDGECEFDHKTLANRNNTISDWEQATGFYDSDNKEVFVNDILQIDNYRGVVKFISGCFMLVCFDGTQRTLSWHKNSFDIGRVKIIGNVHSV